MSFYNMRKSALLIAVLLTLSSMASADVRVTKAFTDNAVLQRDVPVCVWGYADAGEEVSVSFKDQTVTAKADESGNWKVELKAMPGGFAGSDLVISGKNTITLTNVAVGEVWICSGQSNMEMPLSSWGQKYRDTGVARVAGTLDEILGDFSFVRFNRVAHETALKDKSEVNSNGWQECKSGAQKDCTAAGFHFGVRLAQELGCAIGLIDSNWGGSNINSWIPDEGWANCEQTAEIGKKMIADRDAKGEANYGTPGGMYYAMLAPWKNYTVRGAIWYQGCSNAGEGGFYYYKQKAMILEWRKVWGELPFYWVQLANFMGTTDDANADGGWARIRDGQTRCLDVPNTGQAVIIDVGETGDIHPTNKWQVGNRLAVNALAQIYGKKIAYASPLFKEVAFGDGCAKVKFDNVGAGLTAGVIEWGRNFKKTDNPLKYFAVAGEDGKFFWAEAKIVGTDTVELTCKDVQEVKAVRYAWHNNPAGCNLYSAEGLPATPFTTVK